jgi:hypothetical protein
VGVMMLVMLAACGGPGAQDLTQPVFRTPEPVGMAGETVTPPAPAVRGGADDEPPTASASPSVTPTATPMPTLTRTPTATPTAPAMGDPAATESESAPAATATATAAVPNTATAATATATATPAPAPMATATATATATRIPSSTPLPSPTATSLPRPTARPTATPEPDSGVISGRVLLDGAPPESAVRLTLEDQATLVVRELEVTGGSYRFEALPASAEGYNVTFTQDRNPEFGVDDVVSWAWIGPAAVRDGCVTSLPDLEIGLLGLHQLNPSLDAFIGMGAATPANPLVFKWTPYPAASRYWVDLHAGGTLARVWQSGVVTTESVAFDGNLDNGETLQPGTYWWRVGAQVDGINLTVSGPLAGFTVRP